MLMKRYRLALLACAATAGVLSLALTIPARAQHGANDLPAPRTPSKAQTDKLQRVIIKLKTSTSDKSLSQQFEASGKAGVQSLNSSKAVQAAGPQAGLTYLKTIHSSIQVATTDQALSREEMTAFLEALSRDPSVEYAEIDEKVFPHMTPTDSLYSGSLWNLKSPTSQIAGANFEYAWDRKIGASTPVDGSNVVVAVIDSGYRPHADLAANILPGYDFITADNPPFNTVFTTSNDGDGRDADALDPGDWNTTTANGCNVDVSTWHGTHVAGIISAIGNNATGILGGAFKAKVLPVRALGICGGFSSDIQEGMYWAAGLHQVNGTTNPHIAKVINMSLGSTNTCSSSYQTAVTAVVNAGTAIIVSAGNESSTTLTSPANCTGVIAVTAHTTTGNKASFANSGTGTAISAPGEGIYSTVDTGTRGPVADTIRVRSGTSMAAPHVAAAVALLLQVKPSLTPAQIKSLLTSNARAFPSGTNCAGVSTCGAGMLDAFAAVKALQISEGAASNTPPAMTSASAITGNPGVTLQFTLTARDAEGDAITFASSTLPGNATLDTSSGVLRWTAPVLGTYTFSVTPSDSNGSGVAQTVTLSVTNPVVSQGGGGGGGAFAWLELAGLLGLFGLSRLRYPRVHRNPT